jgi:DNA-binding transcriptional ArsR family regulator
MVQYFHPALDLVFSALGDPKRRAMLTDLMSGEASVSALGKPHCMTLAGTAKHIGALADAGLISHRKIGRTRICRLQPEALKNAAGWWACFEKLETLPRDG